MSVAALMENVQAHNPRNGCTCSSWQCITPWSAWRIARLCNARCGCRGVGLGDGSQVQEFRCALQPLGEEVMTSLTAQCACRPGAAPALPPLLHLPLCCFLAVHCCREFARSQRYNVSNLPRRVRSCEHVYTGRKRCRSSMQLHPGVTCCRSGAGSGHTLHARPHQRATALRL
jgi:hypothetical protein